MKVVLFERSCEGCQGNHALNKIKQVCSQQGIAFQEHQTIFWEVWEEEANQIMALNPGLKLPFLYCEDNGATLHVDSLTLLDQIERWIKNACEES